MAEYLERKAAINRIKEYVSDVYDIDLDDAKQFSGYSRAENYCEGLYEATELIDDMPAADVMPVVRCKDCESAEESDDHKYVICCNLGVGMEKDDYCSHGVRKDV